MIPTKPMHLNVTLHLGDFNCPLTESNIDIAARRIGFPLVCVKAARTKYYWGKENRSLYRRLR